MFCAQTVGLLYTIAKVGFANTLTVAVPAHGLLLAVIVTEYKPALLIFMVGVPCPDDIPGPDQTIVLVVVLLGITDNTPLPDIQVGAVIVGLRTEG